MFKKFKNIFAKVALSALMIQLVFLGVGVAPVSALASAGPTANVVHDLSTKTITYNFSEPVELRNNDNSPAELTTNKLGIFVVTSGNYDLSTKTTNTITSAVFNSDKTQINLVYSGSLVKQVNTDYVVDAWGYLITDVAGNKLESSSSQIFTVVGDSSAPVVQTTFTPAIVGNLSNVINVSFDANENVIVSNLSYKVDGIAFSPIDPSLAVLDSSNYELSHTLSIPGNFFTGAKQSIEIAYSATDEAGNILDSKVTIPVEIIAPTLPYPVTNLTVTVSAEGFAVLSWTNPTDGNYKGLTVYRDGAFLTTLAVGTTSFTDTNVVAGQTYYYSIATYNDLGSVVIAPVSVSLPSAKIAAGVSDSVLGTTTEDQGTVSETNKEVIVDKKEDVTNDSGLPAWGIILLLVLAAIGGYLIYSQKPSQALAKPEVKPVSSKPKSKSTTKTNTKKK